MEKLPYYHLFGGKSHEPAVELAEKIKALAPGRMARVFYQSSGSEANDTQVKLAWYYNNALGRPAKKKIIAPDQGLSRGHHRRGLADRAASTTIATSTCRCAGIRHLATPHFWKGAEPGESEAAYRRAAGGGARGADPRAEGPETVAAFIAEPVMGAGGVIVPPKGYFEAMGAVCRKYDILMISDEVICGFGRTGEWFGAQTLDYRANSMSMAKQLTGGYLPLSARWRSTRDMAEVIEANSGRIGTFGHGYTYGGHPVACAVGVKALEIYERIDIPAPGPRRWPRGFAAHLDRLAEHPLVGEARHLGLMGAIELAPEKSPKGFAQPGKVGPRLAQELIERGVISRAIGDTLVFCPPMIITEAEIDEIFAPVGGGARRDAGTGRRPRGTSAERAARRQSNGMNPLRGIGLKILSVMVFTLMAICIKASAAHVPPGQAVFFRSFFAIPVILVWLALEQQLRHGLEDPAPARPPLARAGRHLGDGARLHRARAAAAAGGDGARLCRAAPHGDLRGDVPRRAGAGLPADARSRSGWSGVVDRAARRG